MIVVGGTYEERCRDPQSIRLAGSGLRAAGVLARVDPDIELVSAIDDLTLDVAEATRAGLRIRRRRWVQRTAPIGFQYDTPLSPPLVGGTASRVSEPVAASASAVLLFGMIEADPMVEADILVIDPQHNFTIEAIGAQQSSRLAIVANRSETLALARTTDLERAAQNLRNKLGAEVIAVKLGALGVLVVTEHENQRVGPIPTTRMWPIGSGDAFSAGFAWAFTGGASSVNSAAAGCSAAAAWCSTESLPLPADAFNAVPVAAPVRTPKIYLAAPFFDVGQRWLVEVVRFALMDLGAEVFSPLHDVGYSVPDAAAADLAGLASCDSVLALLDGSDPGTVFECGWATDRGIPVTGFCQRGDPEALSMIRGSGAIIHEDMSSAVYASIWRAFT